MIIPDALPEDSDNLDCDDQERQAHLAGVLARAYERAGLAAKADDFSWDFHVQFDAAIEEATGTTTEPTSSPEAEGQVANAEAGATASDFGPGSFFSGDFGAF